MAVGQDYMLEKPAGPSMPKLFLDTQVVPLAVNVLGGAEVLLDRAAVRTGVRPAVLLAGLAGLACVGLFEAVRRWPRRRAPAVPTVYAMRPVAMRR